MFWNVSELERQNVLSFLKPYESGGYDQKSIKEENENMTYTYTEVLYVDITIIYESCIMPTIFS